MIFFRLAAKILTYVQASARRPQALSATCAEARPGNVRTPPARRSGAAAKPFCNPLVFRRLQKALQKTANRSPICRLSACERPSFATRFAVFQRAKGRLSQRGLPSRAAPPRRRLHGAAARRETEGREMPRWNGHWAFRDKSQSKPPSAFLCIANIGDIATFCHETKRKNTVLC